jgi:hypothetical protein
MKRSACDVIVVSVGATLGLAAAETEIYESLIRLGVDVRLLAAGRPWLIAAARRGGSAGEVAAMGFTRIAVDRITQELRPRSFILPTSLVAAAQSPAVLSRSAVRFDSLAASSRPGWKGGIQRSLERRSLPQAKMLLPWSMRPDAHYGLKVDIPAVPLPPSVTPGRLAGHQRERLAVHYAANPAKKGLDLAVEAWEIASLPGWTLAIVGIDGPTGRAFLRSRGISEPPSVNWSGRLGHDEFRRLLGSAQMYLNASRFEDFGIAQLEALSEGAILASTATGGPIDAVPLARRLDPRTVAVDQSAQRLAHAIHTAAHMSERDREAYRDGARKAMAAYAPEAFDIRMRDEVLPVLLPR